MQNSKYEINLTPPIPLIFVYYDSSIAAQELIEFCFSFQFGESESAILSKIQYMSKKPKLEDLWTYSLILPLEQRTNGTTYAYHLTELILKYKQLQKQKAMLPCFLLIPSNPATVYMDKSSPNGGLNIPRFKLKEFNDALIALANVGEPSYIYLRNQNDLSKAFNHYAMLAVATAVKHGEMTFNQLQQRQPGKTINNNPNAPSLFGLLLLLFKYAAFMSKENNIVSDTDFINSMTYCINLNKHYYKNEMTDFVVDKVKTLTDEEKNAKSIGMDITLISKLPGIMSDHIQLAF